MMEAWNTDQLIKNCQQQQQQQHPAAAAAPSVSQ